MALCSEHPKRDQNPKFTPLSETTSIPVCFIWESLPPARNVYLSGGKATTSPEKKRTRTKNMISVTRIYLLANSSNESRARHQIYNASKKNVLGKFFILPLMHLSMLCPRGGGKPRDRVGTLIRNENLESYFLILGMRFQFKVPNLGEGFEFHISHETENFKPSDHEVKNMCLHLTRQQTTTKTTRFI